jgi:hypothetical protein
VELELAIGVDYGMTGVVSSGKTHYQSCLFGEQVNYLSFALVTPLCSNNGDNWHFISFPVQ